MNRKQNIKFLTSLGIPKERAEAMSKAIPDDAAETPETEVNEAFESVNSHQVDLFKNGDDYKKALKEKHDQAMREIMQKSESKIIKIAGLTAEETKDKKFDEIVELAWGKASKSSDKTVDDLQKELRDKDAEIANLKDIEIPKIRSEIDAEKLGMKIRTGSLAQISKLKLRAGVDTEDALVLFEAKAKAKGYKTEFNEKGEMIILNSDGSKIMTEDKRGMLSISDIYGGLLDGLIEKSGAPDGDDKKKRDIIVPEKDKKEGPKQGSVVMSNLQKAEEHAKKLKEVNK